MRLPLIINQMTKPKGWCQERMCLIKNTMNFEKPLNSQFVRIMVSFASHEATSLPWSCPPLPSQTIVLKRA